MQITAAELSQLLEGTVEGDPNTIVTGPSKIEEGIPGTISFLANPKYESYAYQTNASILLVGLDFKPTQPIKATLIRVENVYASVALLLERFDPAAEAASGVATETAIHPTVTLGENTSVGIYTVIEEDTLIGANTIVHPQVFIGKRVKIGKNVVLYPGVKIYHGCEIGDNCILHANVVIGSDGFGFLPDESGKFKKIPQIGNVILEKDVEIGANTVIDRATMGSTILRAGVKLDNLIQIAHNVEVGEDTAIAAQAGIAGSTKIGKNCLIGGQAGFVGHIKVADGSKIQAQSGVASPIKKPGTAVYGSPALPYADYLKAYAVFKQLPALNKQIRGLQKEIDRLKGTNSNNMDKTS